MSNRDTLIIIGVVGFALWYLNQSVNKTVAGITSQATVQQAGADATQGAINTIVKDAAILGQAAAVAYNAFSNSNVPPASVAVNAS